MKKKSENFWNDKVSDDLTKKNIPPDAWERICKIRNSPIELIQDVIVGESHKPHTVLPKGLKGYLLDYPEAFFLTEKDIEYLSDHNAIFQGIHSELESIPAVIRGYEELVFLHDDEYEIIPLFFDLGLACYAESIVRKGGTDASTKVS